MSPLTLTNHAVKRMSQRSFRMTDADLIALIGTAVEDGYLVRAKDYQAIEGALKQFLQRCRRLIDKRVVVSDGMIVTVYHAAKPRRRQLFRRAHESDLGD
jgi:hypothetical protein